MKSSITFIVLGAVSVANLAAVKVTFYDRDNFYGNKVCNVEVNNNDFTCKQVGPGGKLAYSANWVGVSPIANQQATLKKCLCFYTKDGCQGTTRCWDDAHPPHDQPRWFVLDQIAKNITSVKLNLINTSKISKCNLLDVL